MVFVLDFRKLHELAFKARVQATPLSQFENSARKKTRKRFVSGSNENRRRKRTTPVQLLQKQNR